MPACALPQSFRKGKLSYTISSTNTKARIEVLLKQRAFRIVKIGEKDGCYGQEQNGFKGFVLPLKVLGWISYLPIIIFWFKKRQHWNSDSTQSPDFYLLLTCMSVPAFIYFSISKIWIPHMTPLCFPKDSKCARSHLWHRDLGWETFRSLGTKFARMLAGLEMFCSL